jgi:hypothetical protein
MAATINARAPYPAWPSLTTRSCVPRLIHPIRSCRVNSALKPVTAMMMPSATSTIPAKATRTRASAGRGPRSAVGRRRGGRTLTWFELRHTPDRVGELVANAPAVASSGTSEGARFTGLMTRVALAKRGDIPAAGDRYAAAKLLFRLLDYEGSAYGLSGLAGLAQAQGTGRGTASKTGIERPGCSAGSATGTNRRRGAGRRGRRRISQYGGWRLRQRRSGDG